MTLGGGGERHVARNTRVSKAHHQPIEQYAARSRSLSSRSVLSYSHNLTSFSRTVGTVDQSTQRHRSRSPPQQTTSCTRAKILRRSIRDSGTVLCLANSLTKGHSTDSSCQYRRPYVSLSQHSSLCPTWLPSTSACSMPLHHLLSHKAVRWLYIPAPGWDRHLSSARIAVRQGMPGVPVYGVDDGVGEEAWWRNSNEEVSQAAWVTIHCHNVCWGCSPHDRCTLVHVVCAGIESSI